MEDVEAIPPLPEETRILSPRTNSNLPLINDKHLSTIFFKNRPFFLFVYHCPLTLVTGRTKN